MREFNLGIDRRQRPLLIASSQILLKTLRREYPWEETSEGSKDKIPVEKEAVEQEGSLK